MRELGGYKVGDLVTFANPRDDLEKGIAVVSNVDCDTGRIHIHLNYKGGSITTGITSSHNPFTEKDNIEKLKCNYMSLNVYTSNQEDIIKGIFDFIDKK